MRFLSFIFLFSFFITSFVGLNRLSARSKIVATVNNKKIPLHSFNYKYNEILKGAINPPTKQQFLEDLVRFEMGVQEAQRQKGRFHPQVQEEMRKLLYRWLLEKELSSQVYGIRVSENEMRRYYNSNPEIRVSHILLEMRSDTTTKQKAHYRRRAQQIYTKVKRSKRPFRELVKLYTDDLLTKDSGGDLGWQARNTMIPHYYNTAIKQRIGQIAPLIETKYGFHIVKLTGKNPYNKANKETLQQAVFENKKKRLFDVYLIGLKKRYRITKDQALMKKLASQPVNTAQKSRAIASVNKQNITFDTFQQAYTKVVNETINPPNHNQFLDDLIQFEMGVQEAKKKRIAANSTVQEEMRKLLYRWLVEKDLGSKVQGIKVSETEMRRYYRNNPEIRTSHILIELSQDATKQQKSAARKRAMQIYADVKKSKRPFEELVKLYTDDVFTKDMGGDLGWQSRSMMMPAYYNAVIKLRPGQIAPLIKTQYGFHIIKLTGKHNYNQARKEYIRLAIFERKRAKLFNDYFTRLKKRYKITKNLALLK